MANPYTAPSISGYNSNPPPDDGSNTAANEIKWSTQKTKLADPIKTLAETDITNTTAAFLKVLGGNGVTSTAISYTVVAADQGKLVRATAASITITTPDATDVTAPFVFALLNNSSGTITFDGNGSQTIDGNANITVTPGSGMVIFTDGSNWFTTGQQGTLVGKQLMFGDVINGTITESNATNAVTYSLKTLAGNDPSSTDQVLVCFRSATATSGIYVYRNITSATSLTISSGSTLGATNSVAFNVWLVLFDDSGTIRMGAINCRSGVSIYQLGALPVVSSTAEGGAGAADSAHVFYTGTAVTSKPYVVLGYCEYGSGLATAGSWNVSPSIIQLVSHGTHMPGETIQVRSNTDGGVATGSTAVPYDDTIPQNTEGDQYMTQAITPTSAANILIIDHLGTYANNTGAKGAVSLYQDTTADALMSQGRYLATNEENNMRLYHKMVAGTASATTFKIRMGATSGTNTLNGSAAARKFGGVNYSVLEVKEIMA